MVAFFALRKSLVPSQPGRKATWRLSHIPETPEVWLPRHTGRPARHRGGEATSRRVPSLVQDRSRGAGAAAGRLAPVPGAGSHPASRSPFPKAIPKFSCLRLMV